MTDKQTSSRAIQSSSEQTLDLASFPIFNQETTTPSKGRGTCLKLLLAGSGQTQDRGFVAGDKISTGDSCATAVQPLLK